MRTHEAIPKDWPVQPVAPGTKGEDIATDGYCGLSWDDGKVTDMTPAPSARCPFEPFHVYPEDSEPEDDPEQWVCRACGRSWDQHPKKGEAQLTAESMREDVEKPVLAHEVAF